LQQVDDAAVAELYQQSHFSVFPSIIEGFGLPIMESLWNARPCVCANFGVMQELASGGGCLTVDVRDPQTMAAGLRRLITESSLRETLAKEAQTRVMKTWDDYALEVLQHIGRKAQAK
jgi:glycosyltransferase involved in cell wall biosynthesis